MKRHGLYAGSRDDLEMLRFPWEAHFRGSGISPPESKYFAFFDHVYENSVSNHFFFLILQVNEEQRYALLEYVCHLIAKDYTATLDDLIVLGEI